MITSIQGLLTASTPLHATIELNGFGYEVNVPLTTAEKLPPPGAVVKLHTLVIYREDYRRGGLAMLSVDDPEGRHTGRMVLLYAVALLPVSLLPTLLGVTGALYFFGALVLGLAYAGASIAMTLAATNPRAWRLFLVSIVYLPALLTLMVLDKA